MKLFIITFNIICKNPSFKVCFFVCCTGRHFKVCQSGELCQGAPETHPQETPVAEGNGEVALFYKPDTGIFKP